MVRSVEKSKELKLFKGLNQRLQSDPLCRFFHLRHALRPVQYLSIIGQIKINTGKVLKVVEVT